tara:strand:+ start:594 stop:1946 length:1353 start_codon:yes stop_codon:yes gene_type:complete
MNESKICIHPWSHVNINPNGDVWPCCHQRGDVMYVLGNFKTQSVDEIFNGEPIRKIRRDMIAGKLPKEVCSKCIEYEKLDILSPRQTAEFQPYAKKVHELIAKTNADGSIDDYKIKYWDLRWSNKCNMNCVMCDPDWSSLWTSDVRKLLSGYSQKVIDEDQMLKNYSNRVKHIDKVQNVPNLGWIDKHINDVEYIYFAGGEPLIMDEHWYILDKLHNLGRHNVKLKYNTNMSKLEHLGKNAIDYWKHWERPFLSVEGSIDETEKRAEWIRSGTVWKTVQSNIQKLVSENIKCQPNVSIGCYNVIRLPELIEELYELYYNPNNKTLKVNLNAVLNDWCKISILPDDWKKELIDKIQKFENTTKIPISQLNKVYVELHKPQDEHGLHKFFRKASFLDLNKHSSLLESIPELSRLNDSYGNLYEKYKDEWIEKSINKGIGSINTNLRRSIRYG